MSRREAVYDPGAHPDDAVRQELFEALLDPSTTARIGALGVPRGARCLEVGAGRGSIALHLLAATGSLGEVVATDIDTGWLAQVSHPCLRVVEHDITSDPADALGTFDVIHTRMVLHHFGADGGAASLAALCGLLRPGGWILVEDMINDSAVVDHSDDDASELGARARRLAELDGATRQLARQGGTDLRFGLRLPGLLRSRGLSDVGNEVTSVVAGGDELARRWRLASTRALRSRALDAGVLSADEHDELLELLADDSIGSLGFLLVGAWGHAVG